MYFMLLGIIEFAIPLIGFVFYASTRLTMLLPLPGIPFLHFSTKQILRLLSKPGVTFTLEPSLIPHIDFSCVASHFNY